MNFMCWIKPLSPSLRTLMCTRCKKNIGHETREKLASWMEPNPQKEISDSNACSWSLTKDLGFSTEFIS